MKIVAKTWKLLPDLEVIDRVETIYDSGPIQTSEFRDHSGEISFFFSNGDVFHVDISKHVKLYYAFHGSYGISVSNDGKFFYVQDWSKGLLCFEISSGKLVWQHKQKRATHLILQDHTLICRFMEKYLALIVAATGEILNTYPITTYNCVFQILNDHCLLVGPKRGKFVLLDSQLQKIATIPSHIMNPHMHDYFSIMHAYLDDDGITISGDEYSFSQTNGAQVPNSPEKSWENKKYTRHIPLDPQIMARIR